MEIAGLSNLICKFKIRSLKMSEINHNAASNSLGVPNSS